MAISTSYFASDLDAVIADLPAVASWSGTTFNCSIAQLAQETTLSLVGDIDKITFDCTFPVYAIDGLPRITPNDRFQVQFPSATIFTNFEVGSVAKSADFVAYHLTLKADHRN